jgi:hypothetical protein
MEEDTIIPQGSWGASTRSAVMEKSRKEPLLATSEKKNIKRVDILAIRVNKKVADERRKVMTAILSWDEVSEIHKIRNGIYHRNGRLISLLTDFGRINPCYPDAHGENRKTIIYTGYGRRGDQKLDSFNRALLAAVGSAHAVPLFNKLSPGRWEFLGYWKVVSGEYVFDQKQSRMVWQFTLEQVIK